MASLAETFGAWGTAVFVPADVIKSQAETQARLEQRAQTLNANVPASLAVATGNGILTDGQAKQSMQDMNKAVFLVNQSQRELGSQILDDVLSSAANAPKTLITYTNDQVLAPATAAVGGGIKNLIPWQLWLIVGVTLALGVAVFAYVKGKSPV